MATNNYSLKAKPSGVVNTRKQIEYQFFPEEYFTGADCTIYFGDLWVEDVVSLAFSLREFVEPIYGYASRTWDDVARGKRIVQGQFNIAFKEAGYLYQVIDHIAKGPETKPQIAYLITGEDMPDWIAPIKTRIEDALTTVKTTTTNSGTETYTDYHDWPVMKYGDTDASVAKPKKNLHNKSYNGSVSEMQDDIFNYQKIKWSNASYSWTLPMKQEYDENGKSFDGKNHITTAVKQLQTRLNQYPGLTSLPVTGRYGPMTKAAVLKFQKYAGLSQTGIVDSNTKSALERGCVVSGNFLNATRVALCLFQEKHGITPNGIMDEATKKLLSHTVKKSIPVTTTTTVDKSEDMLAEYEMNIWGRRSLANEVDEYKHRTYFYQNGDQSWLKKEGFDIYITYGPLNEDMKIRGNKFPEYVNYNTTVKAIRGIQLTDVTQSLNADGNVVYETYTFIATDID